MSDNQKTSALLAEYRIDRQAPVAPGVTRITAGHNGHAMTDEIIRLRDENASLRAEIDRLRLRCRQIENEVWHCETQIERLKAAAKDSAHHYADARVDIDRLTSILAALREPSEGVVDVVFRNVFESDPAFEDQCRAAAQEAIRAAVAAAEQEVGP